MTVIQKSIRIVGVLLTTLLVAPTPGSAQLGDIRHAKRTTVAHRDYTQLQQRARIILEAIERQGVSATLQTPPPALAHAMLIDPVGNKIIYAEPALLAQLSVPSATLVARAMARIRAQRDGTLFQRMGQHKYDLYTIPLTEVAITPEGTLVIIVVPASPANIRSPHKSSIP